ncbi:hypothetical protein THERMOS_1097 [Bathymodiolus thermophilus thioautotrophic gill symbiont]|uniref:Uncharacterized protein n=1 Tax=Bathymodiolus thermophilus thioautotrophic gill symbiont TaxID=2360 RepID=A0A8H8XCT0_9GAMM|nr:hypothetical protein THERMOS_1097 [Bathymodiolus thermophilus thioautotrophic gill symbiont]
MLKKDFLLIDSSLNDYKFNDSVKDLIGQK